MSKITFPFGDAEHDFKLTIGGLKEVQEKTGVGPLTLFNRLIDGSWQVSDAREVIRIALIGGGTKPIDALSLVNKYVDNRPLLEGIEPALRIMSHALSGSPTEQEDTPPKKEEALMETPKSPSVS